MRSFLFMIIVLAGGVGGFGGQFPQNTYSEQTCTATNVTNQMYEDVFVGGLKILYNISTQGPNDKSCLFLIYDRTIQPIDVSNVTLLYYIGGTYVTRTAVVVLSNGKRPLIDFYSDNDEYRKLSGEVTSDGVVVLVDCREEGNDILIACKISECNQKLYSCARDVAERVLQSSYVGDAVVGQSGCGNAPKRGSLKY